MHITEKVIHPDFDTPRVRIFEHCVCIKIKTKHKTVLANSSQVGSDHGRKAPNLMAHSLQS